MPEPEPLPAIKTPWGAATPSSGAGAGDVPPIPIPDHTLIRRVGKGSYGEVWLARNILGVYRAVKIIQRSSFDDDRPFEREFAGMQRFEPVSRSHESQLNILQVGRGPDCFYYVMELADDMGRGAAINEASYSPRNLRSELLLHGRLPVDECVRLGLALTTALENLHRHGLVHRDIKPSNIVFVNGIPKLADIGLVALAESTMSFVGTEGYLPPEGPGTVQADLFSLGKVLYEISTGRDRQQFPELPTGISELPDRAALAEFNEVILRACAPDVKQRYESAAEMHADLALLQSGKSVSRMRAVERRLKFVARAGAAVTGLALLAGGAFFYQQVQTREARRLASENQALAAAKTQLAEDKSKLAEENRERLVRLDIANGVRLMDAGDYSGALLWFAEALPLVTNHPAQETMHRIRIQQTLDQTPRLLVVIGCFNSVNGGGVTASAWHPDGQRFALVSCVEKPRNQRRQYFIQLHDGVTGRLLWSHDIESPSFISQLRFSQDGKRLLATTSIPQGLAAEMRNLENAAMVLNADTGAEIYRVANSELVWATFSPDDRWLALADTNHVIRVVNAVNGSPMVELKGHTNTITMLSFSADGRLLASASEDQTARLWRLPSGEAVGIPLVHPQAVRRVVLSDDGQRLLTSTAPSETDKVCLVQLWEVSSGRRVGDPMRETNFVYGLSFSPGPGDRFLLDGDQSEVEVRDSRSLERVYPPLKMNSVARCWEFSPDGKRCVVGSTDGAAYVWNFETGELLHPPFRHTGWVEAVRFSPDGQRLLTGSDDGTAKVWSLRRRTEAASLALSANLIALPAEQHRPRGRTPGPIPVPLADGWLHLVDPERLVDLQTLKPRQTNVPMVGWVAGLTGRYWALGEPAPGPNRPDRVTLWTFQDGAFTWRELPLPDLGGGTQFNADDSGVLTLGRDRVIRLWRTSDGNLERSVPLPQPLFWPDQQIPLEPFDLAGQALLVAAGETWEDQRLQLFDLATSQLKGKPFYPCQVPLGMDRMRLSPDGLRLAALSGQGGAIIDLQTGDLAGTPFKHGGDLLDMDWSPDGKRLVTAGLGGVKVWDAATGEMFGAPLSGSMSARWSADGRFIATRGEDRLARVFDASTTEPVTPFLPHSGYIRFTCITPGNRLITGSDPNLLRAWDLKPTPLAADVIADYAKLLSGRKLNAGGVMLPLKPDELAELSRSLHARAPQLFE